MNRQAQIPVVVVLLSCARVFVEEHIAWIVQHSIVIQIREVIDRIWIAVLVRQPPGLGAIEVWRDGQRWTLTLNVAAIGVSNC